MNNAKERLSAAILDQCVKTFTELKERSDVRYGAAYGEFPSEAVVTHRHHAEHPAIGAPIARWRVIDGHAVSVPIENSAPADRAVSGMYYSTASFSFSFSDDLSTVYTHMTLGPRFGRGYSYSVMEENGEFLFCREKLIWVS